MKYSQRILRRECRIYHHLITKSVQNLAVRPIYSRASFSSLNRKLEQSHEHRSLSGINSIYPIFTPIGFSFQKLNSIYMQNLSILDEKITAQNIDVSKTVNHIKNLANYELSDSSPSAGSLVHLETNIAADHSNSFGIVLTDLNFQLSAVPSYTVLFPNGEIRSVVIDNINFFLPRFINKDVLHSLLAKGNKNELIDFSFIDNKSIIHLTYILNIFMLNWAQLSNKILSEDLIRTSYLKNSMPNFQTSTDLITFSSNLVNGSTVLQNILNFERNPLSTHSLVLSCHFFMFNDPIHFRIVKPKNSIYSVMNPLNQITTKYFTNPILLSENLENLYIQPNQIIRRSYFDILKNADTFQIFNILQTDENFKRLILMMRYFIAYPDRKLLEKLKDLIPFDKEVGGADHKYVYDLLKKLSVYDESINPIISSGIYGFNSLNPMDLSTPIKFITELQYYYNRNYMSFKNPRCLQKIKPLKSLGMMDPEKELIDKNHSFRNKNYSVSLIRIVEKAKTHIWPKLKKEERGSIYKLNESMAFSIDRVSLTKYTVNVFVPIPNQAPNEIVTIHEPIKVLDSATNFPKLVSLNTCLRINQPCIKLAYNYNLVDSESLTSPNIKVGLDMFKKIEKLDNDWFENKKLYSLKGSRKRVKCWVSLDKLLNFLKEKEKSRTQLGYLKTYHRSDDDADKSVSILQKNLLQNNNTSILEPAKSNGKTGNSLEENINMDYDMMSEEYRYDRVDRSWMIDNMKLLLDENLSRFCFEKGINVISRSLDVGIHSSIDHKVFKKFKIFKWLANSYDSFNFQLSSNPGDLTALSGCISFLNSSNVSITNEQRASGETRKYLPLGIKNYSSFTSLNYMETHLNLWQLFRYLLVKSVQEVKRLEGNDFQIGFKPEKLSKVTGKHFQKCIAQSEGLIEFTNRLNRFEILSGIMKNISGGTNINGPKLVNNIFRCVVLQVLQKRTICYCCELDTEVEVIFGNHDNKKTISIGDRLLCSEIVELDVLNDTIVLR